MQLETIVKESAPLRSRIVASIRRAIETGVLKPGEKLVEKELCSQLGVSRTSLREAMRRLEAEGIIAQAATRGLTVAKISYRDAQNIPHQSFVASVLMNLSAERAACFT